MRVCTLKLYHEGNNKLILMTIFRQRERKMRIDK